MMKNIIKTIAILAITVLTLAGCATNNETEFNVNEVISEVLENTSTASEVEEPTTSTTTTSIVESEPVESSTTSTITSEPTETTSTPEVNEETSKPTASTPASTPVETPKSSSTITSTPKSTTSTPSTPSKPSTPSSSSKPASSSTPSSSTKPVETTSTPTTSTPTTSTPATSTPTTSTPSAPTAPVEKVHNCKTDGHVWKKYTETSTEEVEIEELHLVVANGYDRDLAAMYLREDCTDFTPYFGHNAYSEGTTLVKTTGTKTITTFYHECTECGHTEAYDTKEEVIPGKTWSFVYPEDHGYFNVVWYDINNIPAEVLEAAERDNAASEDFWDTF